MAVAGEKPMAVDTERAADQRRVKGPAVARRGGTKWAATRAEKRRLLGSRSMQRQRRSLALLQDRDDRPELSAAAASDPADHLL
jgi:hypothetical protein